MPARLNAVFGVILSTILVRGRAFGRAFATDGQQ
jgi:hypothetical protein